MARILSEGSRYLPNLWLGSSDPKTESASTASGATAAAAEAAVAATAGAAGAKSGVIRTRSGTTPASATDHRTSEALLPPSALGVRRLREEEEEELPIELWSFEVFLRACGVYFCFQVRVRECLSLKLASSVREIFMHTTGGGGQIG